MTNPFKTGDRVTTCLLACLGDTGRGNTAPYLNHNHGGCTEACRKVHIVTKVTNMEVYTDITKWGCAIDWFNLVEDDSEPLTRLELIFNETS